MPFPLSLTLPLPRLRDLLRFTLPLCVALSAALQAQSVTAAETDVHHTAWTSLLETCVVPLEGGHATAVDYACFSGNRSALDAYLAHLSRVDVATFNAWARERRLAFLINAYNAWTVDLILGAWPDLESIRDLGGLLRSPWQKSFIPLLGKTRSLDDIEHGMIREPGSYDDPRIHFAVNCASIGCPALRREAYTADKLEAQLEDQTRRFLSDRSRNRLVDDTLEVSSLFKWYGDDFAGGWRGARRVEAFLALYADALGLTSGQRRNLESGAIDLDFLAYDWALNQVSPEAPPRRRQGFPAR